MNPLLICDHFNKPTCHVPRCPLSQPHENNGVYSVGLCRIMENGREVTAKCIPVPRTKFVCFIGVVEENLGQKFFSKNDPDSLNQCKSEKGETWYRIIGFADTVEEAQMICFGRTYK